MTMLKLGDANEVFHKHPRWRSTPTRGKVFTANTLGDLIAYSDLADFVP